MPVAPHQQGLARRRTVVQAQYGAAVPAVTADSDDLIFLDHEPEPWCTQSLGPARVFRGRLMPGAAVLPPRWSERLSAPLWAWPVAPSSSAAPESRTRLLPVCLGSFLRGQGGDSASTK
jgi:hypothetical protein